MEHSSSIIRIDAPTYRVEFWEQPRPDYAWNLDAWLLTECTSANEALSWAETHANGRRYVVLASDTAEPSGEDATEMVLFGTDPTQANRKD
ncbi:MAG: hypothetical protein ACTILB_15285 [Brevibacterium aurantiacum]